MGMTIDNVKEELISILTEIEITGGSMVTSIYKDELKMAIDTIDKYQMMQADYKNRLKADMVAMLTELKKEIEQLDTPNNNDAYMTCSKLVQEKINKLKERT